MAALPDSRRGSRADTVLVLCRRMFIGVVLAYALISLLLGGSSGARSVFHGTCAAWVAIMLLAPRAMRLSSWKLPRCTRGAELIAFNIALTLIVAESGLRLVAVFSGKSLILSDALESYQLKPGRDYGAGLRGNRLGYPGEDFSIKKRPGIFRIAALGDSFAVGPAVAFDKNYLTLLSALRPDVEVCNFGVSGAGPREYQLILNKDVWTCQPDLVLVSIFVGNDVTESLATPRQMDPRQSALYLLVTRGYRLWRERSQQQSVQDATTPSRIAAAGLAPQAFLDVESRRLAICLKSPSGSLEKKWQRALAYLESIIGDCRSHHVPLAFVLIPDEFQVNPQVLADATAAGNYQKTDLDVSCPQRRLQTFCTRRGIPCLDLLPAFAGHLDTYAPRDTHWNEGGNALAARTIVAWLPTIGDGALSLAGGQQRPAP